MFIDRRYFIFNFIKTQNLGLRIITDQCFMSQSIGFESKILQIKDMTYKKTVFLLKQRTTQKLELLFYPCRKLEPVLNATH